MSLQVFLSEAYTQFLEAGDSCNPVEPLLSYFKTLTQLFCAILRHLKSLACKKRKSSVGLCFGGTSHKAYQLFILFVVSR